MSQKVPFLAVFDTCTQPEYRRDVHRVMALPLGATIRYDYKRYLFSDEAAQILIGLTSNSVPLPAILLYGELKGYSPGDAENEFPMLTTENANFVPIRSAEIVNVYLGESDSEQDQTIHFHLRLKGYIDPDEPEVAKLLADLEERNELPFGDRDSQHTWIANIASAPDLDLDRLKSDDPTSWSRVVEWMYRTGSQFAGDVFWRILSVTRTYGNRSVTPTYCQNNEFGSKDWSTEFLLDDWAPYTVDFRIYDPGAHGFNPSTANASIVLHPNDESGVVYASAQPKQARPNAEDNIRFRLGGINYLGRRYPSIELETQVPGWTDSLKEPGSRCNLKIAARKSPRRMAFASAAAIATLFGTSWVGAMEPPLLSKFVLLVCAGISGFCGFYEWKGEVKI